MFITNSGNNKQVGALAQTIVPHSCNLGLHKRNSDGAGKTRVSSSSKPDCTKEST